MEQPPELGLGQGRAQLPQPPAIVSDVRTSSWGRAPLGTQREASCARSSAWCRPLTVSPACPLSTPSLSLLGAGVLSPWDWGGPSGSSPKPPPCCVSGAAPGSRLAPEPSGRSGMLGLTVPSGDRGHCGREAPPTGQGTRRARVGLGKNVPQGSRTSTHPTGPSERAPATPALGTNISHQAGLLQPRGAPTAPPASHHPSAHPGNAFPPFIQSKRPLFQLKIVPPSSVSTVPGESLSVPLFQDLVSIIRMPEGFLQSGWPQLSQPFPPARSSSP